MSAKTNKRREETTCPASNKNWMLGSSNLQSSPTNLGIHPSSPTFNISLSSPPSYKSSSGLQTSPSITSGSTTINTISSPVETVDPNWQASKASIRERNAAMFNNELMSDVHFLVGPKGNAQRIPAHKYVLATGSSVFYAMFYGGLAENKCEIEIPDVEPASFLALLRYLYCDDINLEADTVLATLYAAKKYLVPHLARACVSYLETSLTAKNACVLLSQSRLFEEPDLMQRCWEVIDAQAELALSSDGFVDIDYNTLESILQRETLNTKEIVLFQAAVNWATAECARRDLEPTAENKRLVLDYTLHFNMDTNYEIPDMRHLHPG